MKSWKKVLLIGGIAGVAELVIAGVLGSRWEGSGFTDVAFVLGLLTFLVGLLGLFRVGRLRTGGVVNPGNANAQAAFAAQVTFEEQKLLSKAKQRASFLNANAVAILLAGVITLVGFGVSLLF